MVDILPHMQHLLKEGPHWQKHVLEMKKEPFYLEWLLDLEMTAAVLHSPRHSEVSFRFTVQNEYLNPSGRLHGAAQSLFFDVCTNFLLGPLARPPDFWTTYGISRSINVVYLRPAKEGDVLTLDCETVNVGKRLALLKGVLKREDGAVISTCEHQLYNVDADAGKL